MISYEGYVCFLRRSTYSPVLLKIIPLIQKLTERAGKLAIKSGLPRLVNIFISVLFD